MEQLIKTGKKVITVLNENGFQGYFVGGFVRDFLLSREINDIDIATDARTEEIIPLFKKVIPTGIKHGTVTIVIDKLPVEVTTFRREGKYSDHRRPDSVEFVTSLFDDLGRRDFTMNAMAMDGKLNLIDPFNGKIALEQKIISTVGNPKERFQEDPLRMLRAIRFASQLNFSIDVHTWEHLLKSVKEINYISIERVKVELDKIINSKNPSIGFNLIRKASILKFAKGLSLIIIENNQVYYDLLNKTEDTVIRWFLVLLQYNEDSRKLILNTLKFSNKETSSIETVFKSYNLMQDCIDNNVLKRCIIDYGYKMCIRAVNVKLLLAQITEKEYAQFNMQINNLEQSLTVREKKDLKVTGKDLIEHFNEPGGPWVKNTLDQLLELVIFNKEANDFSNLIKRAEKIREEHNNEGQD